ncbi:MAG: TadE/TadG family type IV pilus assembly protein [Croceibacterium sp.]
MRTLFSLRRLAANERGASAIEFALLAPVFLGLFMGVVEVGLYMQNYNAVRSLASDASRFAAVEYQKNNSLTEDALEASIQAMGVGLPYNLINTQLTVTVTEVTPARVNGAREFDLDIDYALPDIIGGTTLDNFTVSYSRPLFVLDSSPSPSPTPTPSPT